MNIFAQQEENGHILTLLYKTQKLTRKTYKVLMIQNLLFYIYKSSHQRCSMKKRVLSKLTKLTGKHLARVSFLTKLQALKKRLWHICLPANFVKFLSNARLKLTKNQANAKQHPEAEL